MAHLLMFVIVRLAQIRLPHCNDDRIDPVIRFRFTQPVKTFLISLMNTWNSSCFQRHLKECWGGHSYQTLNFLPRDKLMHSKDEITRDWLPRYTGTEIGHFGDYILLTNFDIYLRKFAERFGSPILGEGGPNADLYQL